MMLNSDSCPSILISVDMGDICFRLMEVYTLLGSYEDSEQEGLQAYSILQQHYDPQSKRAVQVAKQLSFVFVKCGKYMQAAELSQGVIEDERRSCCSSFFFCHALNDFARTAETCCTKEIRVWRCKRGLVHPSCRS